MTAPYLKKCLSQSTHPSCFVSQGSQPFIRFAISSVPSSAFLPPLHFTRSSVWWEPLAPVTTLSSRSASPVRCIPLVPSSAVPQLPFFCRDCLRFGWLAAFGRLPAHVRWHHLPNMWPCRRTSLHVMSKAFFFFFFFRNLKLRLESNVVVSLSCQYWVSAVVGVIIKWVGCNYTRHKTFECVYSAMPWEGDKSVSWVHTSLMTITYLCLSGVRWELALQCGQTTFLTTKI